MHSFWDQKYPSHKYPKIASFEHKKDWKTKIIHTQKLHNISIFVLVGHSLIETTALNWMSWNWSFDIFINILKAFAVRKYSLKKISKKYTDEGNSKASIEEK